MGLSAPAVLPVNFQRAMVFIDGTNLFRRLESAKLALLSPFSSIIERYLNRRQILRIYLYTIEPEFEKAKGRHGDFISDDIRIIYGEGIPTKDGNIKEKGVDALLVADLVYHAANKNYDYALLVSADTDFVQALRRVEDFGCRTGALAICCELPERLRESCDEPKSLSAQDLLRYNWAKTVG